MKNMHLEFGFRVSPLPIALPAINSTQCISVCCLAHHVSDSSYLPFNLPSLFFMFLSLRFDGMLMLSSVRFPFFLST